LKNRPRFPDGVDGIRRKTENVGVD